MASTRKKSNYFYGWNIVAASFLARISYTEHFTSILGLFIKPLNHEFGWGRSSIAGVQTTARVIEAGIAPFVGPLIDRFGPRTLMPMGAFVVGIAMFCVIWVDSLWQFYMLRGVFVAIGFIFMGALVTDVAINNWFVRKRGRAIAIARVGGNLGNFIMAPLCVFIIANVGWRIMFVVFAVVTWLMVMIPSAILMRRRPEDVGLLPDGDDYQIVQNEDSDRIGTQKKAPSAPERSWTRRQAMMTGTFWFIVTSYAINSFSFQGINICMAPYIQDLGYTNTMLAILLTFRSALMIPSGLIMGFFAEGKKNVSMRTIPFLILALAAILFCFAKAPLFLWLAIATYALGSTGVHITQEVLWANYFGRLSLGRVRSLGYFISFGCGSVGPIVMNLIFDWLGSYRPAFLIIACMFLLGTFLIGLARPVKTSMIGD
ncbi:MFS transporter [Thermodesulfobacteriota bacterium]